MTREPPPWTEKEAVCEYVDRQLDAYYDAQIDELVKSRQELEDEALAAARDGNPRPLTHWLIDPRREGRLSHEAGEVVHGWLVSRKRKATRGAPRPTEEEKDKNKRVRWIARNYQQILLVLERDYGQTQKPRELKTRAKWCALEEERSDLDQSNAVTDAELKAYISDTAKSERDAKAKRDKREAARAERAKLPKRGATRTGGARKRRPQG